MRFKSVDELEHFKFQDAQITSFQDESEHLKLELEAVVVRGRHPLNETYTDRYADTVMMRLMGGRIVEAFKEGYKCDILGILFQKTNLKHNYCMIYK